MDFHLHPVLPECQHPLRLGRRHNHAVFKLPGLWDKRSHSCLHVSPWVLQGTRNAIGAVRVHDAGGFGAAALLPACVCLRLVQLPAGEPRTFAPHSLEDSRGAMGAATPAHEARDKGQGLCLHMHSRTLTPAQGFHTAPPNTEPELTAFPKGGACVSPNSTGCCSRPHPGTPTPTGRETIKSNGPVFLRGSNSRSIQCTANR